MAKTILGTAGVPRRVTVSALALSIALVAVWAGFSAPPADAAGPTYYNVTGLDTPWNGTIGRDINEFGQIVGQGQNPSGQARAFLWEGGKMRDLGVPTGGNLSRARGINGSGQVVGEWRTLVNNRQRFKAFLYENGQMKDLNVLIPAGSGWDLIGAQAISDSGQIVGSGTKGGQTHAFVYKNGTVTDLGAALGDPSSEAWAVNSSGDVVGGSGVAGGGRAFLYADGVADKFGASVDHSVHPSSEAMNLNDSGQVVGWSYTDNGRGRAFLYDNNEDGGATLTSLDPLPDDLHSRPRDINESGIAVGWSRDETGVSQDEQFSAVLWEDGQVKDLNSLIPPNTGWKLVDAYAIDDSGRIVGAGHKDGQTHAFLLTPDTAPPKLQLPADVTAEATTKNGAEVSFAPMATDENPTNPAVTCAPASGTTFPIGETTVTCSAEDKAGNRAEGRFKVTVEDATAPAISGMPSDMTVTATSSSGTVIAYDLPKATDMVDGSVAVECQPASGTTFALGETTVICSASDSRGNTSTETFEVSVHYDWAGFFSPVDNPDVLNLARAGSAVPVKFSLGGDMGQGVFYEEANGSTYPRSGAMACDSTDPVDAIEQTVTANSSGLTYDATTDRYIYVWKTSDGWAGTCRQLVLRLDDGRIHRANFKFK